MKSVIRLINANPYLIFLVNILSIWGVTKPLFLKEIPMQTSLSAYYAHYDWFGFAVQIIVTTILYFVLRAYNRTREDIAKNADLTRIQNEIIKQRGFNLYLIATASLTYQQVPGIPLRTKDADYAKYLADEKRMMRNKMINSDSYNNVSVKEIDEIIDKLYDDFN